MARRCWLHQHSGSGCHGNGGGEKEEVTSGGGINSLAAGADTSVLASTVRSPMAKSRSGSSSPEVCLQPKRSLVIQLQTASSFDLDTHEGHTDLDAQHQLCGPQRSFGISH